MPIAPRGTARRRLAARPESPPESEEPGPWVGAIERRPGRDLVAVRTLDARDDPVAEHHTLGGRRVSALDPARKGLPVVPFTVMAEMLAQAAALLMPGHRRWSRFATSRRTTGSATRKQPFALELRAGSRSRAARRGPRRDPQHGVRVGRPMAPRSAVEGPVVEGSRRLRRRSRDGADRHLRSSWKRRRVSAGSPPRSSTATSGSSTALRLQALVRVGPSSPQGIEGTLRVLPRRDCSASRTGSPCRPTRSCSTPSLTCWDAGGWTSCADGEGDVIFPSPARRT